MNKLITICTLLLFFFIQSPIAYGQELELKYDNPVFATSSKKYEWLNHTIAVGVGKIIDGGVTYKIYAIK